MKNSITYPNRTLRIIISATATLYILFHGRSLDFNAAIKSPIFYIAFIVSFFITLLMVKWVHYISKSLDKYNDWFSYPTKRTLKQILLGVLVPLLIDFSLLSAYFYFLGTNIFENGFFRHDFPVIVLFMFILNSYYALLYIYKINKTSQESSVGEDMSEQKLPDTEQNYNLVDISDHFNNVNNSQINADEKLELEDTPPTHQEYITESSGAAEPLPVEIEKTTIIKNDFLNIICPNTVTDLPFEDFALFFYADDRDVFMVNHKGDEILVSSSLNQLEHLLSESYFIRINRSFILNRKIIFDFANGYKRDTLLLHFGNEYKPLIEKYGNDRFTVTKNYITYIKKYFDKL